MRVEKASIVSHPVDEKPAGQRVAKKASVQKAGKNPEDLDQKIANLKIKKKIDLALISRNGLRKKVHNMYLYLETMYHHSEERKQ